MDPEDKAVIEDKLKVVETQVDKVKKSKAVEADAQLSKEQYDLERYKNSKLFQKFMKQEGVAILQKPPIVKAKGPSPPPYQEELRRDEEEPQEDFEEGYDEQINERVAFSPEPNVVQHPALQKSESTDVELEGYSEHIPPSPARGQMFPDPRSSFNPPPQQPPLYPSPPMYSSAYYYPQPMNPMGVAPMPAMPPLNLPQMPISALPGIVPPLEMQLYFKQMMDLYQRQSAPPSSREPERDTSKDAELENKDKEIKRLQKEVDNCKLDIMQLEDQLRDQQAAYSRGGEGGGDDRVVQELTQELEAMRKRYEATEDELIATQRDCDKAKDELAALKSKKPAAPVEDTQAQDKIIQLEYKLEGALEKISTLEKSLSKEKDINAEAERRLEIARTRIAKMEESIEDLKGALQAKSDELDESKREFMQQMRKMQKEMELMRSEAEGLRNQNERLKGQGSRQNTSASGGGFARSPEPDNSYEPPPRRPQRQQPPSSDYYRDQEQTYADPPPRRDYQNYEEPQRTAPQRQPAYEQQDYDQQPLASSRRRDDAKSSSGLTHFDMIRSVENKLIAVQIERDRVQVEFNKIPEHSKTISQRRRREELEQELEILNSNINSLKSKLRGLTNTKG